jgi:hypothetical protein
VVVLGQQMCVEHAVPLCAAWVMTALQWHPLVSALNSMLWGHNGCRKLPRMCGSVRMEWALAEEG